ncbi:MAG: LptA/OstA family protein [Armatimonadota bacterium]|nr:LptA/OstA family protein [Armatimonadota bacterium]MDR7439604.1 LptA/OstA family protein [Armatimonadota bacterium]MDR7562837.1 LptA/OstA family protein [Armatimonadota bacterium]MDR7568338.1 LptA/OstA family protein [Armatimonadota bacterium]MDR7602083.1 LptA/OstA family protein [Armatimonadota bacterium]
MRHGWILAIILGAILTLPVSAQQPMRPPEPGQGRLQAHRIRYDARNGVFEARGGVRLTLGDVTVTSEALTYHERTRTAWAEGNARVVQGPTTLSAPSIRYEATPQTVHASGDVVVQQPEVTLRARELTYRLRDQLVEATGEVVVEQPDQTLQARALTYRVREKVADATGDVRLRTKDSTLEGEAMWADLAGKEARVRGPARLVRKGGPPPRGREQDRVAAALAKEDTTITASRTFWFSWQQTNEARAEGEVRIVQVDKEARADEARYSEQDDRMELRGRAEIHQRSGQWLVRERLVREPQTEEERKALETPATIQADRIVIYLSTRDAVATGNVRVIQGRRSAVGERAEYDDRNGIILLVGRRARMQREDGAWLEAERVVVSLKEDTFEAYGAVDTTFPVRP